MIHSTAEVAVTALVGEGTMIWHQAQVREDARIGAHCIVGKGVYIDLGVRVGDRVKIQNYACLYHGAVVEDGVFIGPHACLTNDRLPRAVTASGALKRNADWEEAGVLVRQGASVGAGAVVLPGVVVGRFALIGAGGVVTRDVPDHGLVIGNPAKLIGYVCRCGERLRQHGEGMVCPVCGEMYEGLGGQQ